jgi:2-amino-4-hydroxy-6-hydroxymethyldihydropteridine diphosphokinase
MIAAIALGSNLDSTFGDRAANLREAVQRLGALGNVTAISAFHDTAPVGYLEQPRFLNAAALLETDLNPLELLHALLKIEQAMGRTRQHVPAKGPRIIDLDLLLAGDHILATPELTLPHPALADRDFVLEPLAEIAPTWRHPITYAPVSDMLDRLKLQ